jgi:hypothetical protein
MCVFDMWFLAGILPILIPALAGIFIEIRIYYKL